MIMDCQHRTGSPHVVLHTWTQDQNIEEVHDSICEVARAWKEGSTTQEQQVCEFIVWYIGYLLIASDRNAQLKHCKPLMATTELMMVPTYLGNRMMKIRYCRGAALVDPHSPLLTCPVEFKHQYQQDNKTGLKAYLLWQSQWHVYFENADPPFEDTLKDWHMLVACGMRPIPYSMVQESVVGYADLTTWAILPMVRKETVSLYKCGHYKSCTLEF